MVRSWMKCGTVALFVSALAVGCQHSRQCCCPCQCQTTSAATSDKPAAPTAPANAATPKQTTSIPQLVPPGRLMN
jgi:hypothetical protein